MVESKNKKERIFTYFVFGIYLLFLCWLILFKFADSLAKIPSRRSINLIPFYFAQLSGSRFQKTDIIYNVIAFIPAGFFFTAFGKKKIISGILFSAVLSLCFEVLQWIFALGSSDITDLIMNTLGGVIGVVLYFVLGKLFKGREVLIVSIMGAILEGLLIGLLIILFVNN